MNKKGLKITIGGTKLNHSESITDLKYTPDGKYLVSCGWDNTIRIWDSWNGDLVKQINSSSNYLNAITISRDSNLIACGGKKISVYDLTSYKKLFSLKKHKDDIGDIVFSPDGKMLASGCGQSSSPNVNLLRISSTADGMEIAKTKHNSINGIAFSKDSSKVATCCKLGYVKIWDAQSLKCLSEKKISESFNELRSIHFGKTDDYLLVSASRIISLDTLSLVENQQVVPELVEVSESLKLEVHEGFPLFKYGPVDISPDGKMIALGSNRRIRSWNISNKATVLVPDIKHSEKISDADFNQNGSVLYTISDEKVISWDTETGDAIADWNFGKQSICHIQEDIVVIPYKADRLAVFEFEENKDIIELETGTEDWGCGNLLRCSNSVLGYSADSHISLWNTEDFEHIKTIDKPCNIFEISADDQFVAMSNFDEDTVWMYDINNSIFTDINLGKDEFGVSSLKFCSENQLIVLYNSGSRVVWDSNKKELVYEKRISRDSHAYESGQHGFLTVRSDSKYYAVVIDQSIEFYKYENHSLVQSISFANREAPWFIKFAPNGKELFSSHIDQSSRIWNLIELGLT